MIVEMAAILALTTFFSVCSYLIATERNRREMRVQEAAMLLSAYKNLVISLKNKIEGVTESPRSSSSLDLNPEDEAWIQHHLKLARRDQS